MPSRAPAASQQPNPHIKASRTSHILPPTSSAANSSLPPVGAAPAEISVPRISASRAVKAAATTTDTDSPNQSGLVNRSKYLAILATRQSASHPNVPGDPPASKAPLAKQIAGALKQPSMSAPMSTKRPNPPVKFEVEEEADRKRPRIEGTIYVFRVPDRLLMLDAGDGDGINAVQKPAEVWKAAGSKFRAVELYGSIFRGHEGIMKHLALKVIDARGNDANERSLARARFSVIDGSDA
ncbi:hypothetical protein PG993_005734 [Apiospora rasikravindrae]|uniref:Uncharacterized protein n=1 Tax=Apiospora rasikravindrae TaxID=990691 RepID=A0ABR1T9L8_9PEZI